MTVLIIDVVALVVHPVDLERGTLEQNRLAGFLVNFGHPQIDLDLFIQHRVLLVAVGRGLHGILGIGHGRLRVALVGRVNVRDEGLGLEYVLGGGGLDD